MNKLINVLFDLNIICITYKKSTSFPLTLPCFDTKEDGEIHYLFSHVEGMMGIFL